jgi:hypothetical protein
MQDLRVTDPEPPTGNERSDTGIGPPRVSTAEPEASVEDDVGETKEDIDRAMKKEMIYLTKLNVYSSWTSTGFLIVSTLAAFFLFLLNLRQPGGLMGPPAPPHLDCLFLLTAIERILQGYQMPAVVIDRDRALDDIAPNRNPAAVNVAVGHGHGRPIRPVDAAFAPRRSPRLRLLQLERERAGVRVRRGRILVFDR